MRPRDEARKERDCALVNRLSRDAHERDAKANAEPLGFQPRRREDRRTEKSKTFERRWLG